MVGGRDIEILLVEADATEARRTMRILAAAKIRNHVSLVTDAAQALTHLRPRTRRFGSSHPNLILLCVDGLPQGGQELLTAIKCDPHLVHIPVIVLGSSASEENVARAYDLDANSYVEKPLHEAEIDRVLETTREFWLTIVKLPSE